MQPPNQLNNSIPQQINHAIMYIGNYSANPPVNPYFAYTVYNNTTHVSVVNNYKATATGPILVTSQNVVTYDEIPRVGTLDLSSNYKSTSQYLSAYAISNKSNITLDEAVQCIRDYIDKTCIDVDGGEGRRAQMLTVISKIANSLPDDQKADAGEIVNGYRNYDIFSGPIPTNTFEEHYNYVFKEDGSRVRGAAGDLIQIEVNGVLKKPSELDVTDLKQTKALSKVAIFLAAKNGAPQGSRFGTGTKSSDLASKNPAFTVGLPPYFTLFNHHGGSFSKDLDSIYSFTSIIKHELVHQKNFKAIPQVPSNLSTHIDVYLNQITDLSFSKTTDPFQLSIIRSLAIYILNMDKKKYPDDTFVYKQSDVKDKMDTFNNLNLHYKFVYPVPDYTRGSLTIAIKDTNTIKTPENANDSYYTINEK